MNAPQVQARTPDSIVVSTVSSGQSEPVTVQASSLYIFPEALPGLEASHRFALIDRAEAAPFHWLQSLDEASVCLPVLWLQSVVLDGYLGHVAQAVNETEQALENRVLFVARFDESACTFLVNLLAPIVLSPSAGTGKQIVVDGKGYELRQPIEWDAASGVFRLPC